LCLRLTAYGINSTLAIKAYDIGVRLILLTSYFGYKECQVSSWFNSNLIKWLTYFLKGFVNSMRVCYNISINNKAGLRDLTFWDGLEGEKKDTEYQSECVLTLYYYWIEYMIYKYLSASRFNLMILLPAVMKEIIVLVW
jgi:hypothetical protein